MSKTAELQERVKDAKTRLAETVAANELILDAVSAASKDGENPDQVHVKYTTEQKDAFKLNNVTIRDLREFIEGAEATISGKQYLDAPANGSAAVAAAAGAPLNGKSIGQAFIESPEFKSLQGGKAGYTMLAPFELKVGDLPSYALGKSTSDIFTAMPTGTPGDFGAVARQAMVGRPHRTFRVRDLFPAVPTTARVIEYFQVTGFTNNASPTPERDGSNAFQSKPQSALTFAGQQSTVRTIAHWIAAHRNTLADEPQLRNVIDTELLYGLQLREDAQILSGAGTSEDLLGIFNTTNVQTQPQGSDTNADAIRKAITKVALAEYEATGVVIHPSNWEAIELERVNGTSPQQYVNAIVSNVADGAAPRLWRLPIVVTQAIIEDTALVGAFGIGATLYDREEASIRISEHHDSFFVQNAVAILAEQRLALTVQRPEAFCKVTGLD